MQSGQSRQLLALIRYHEGDWFVNLAYSGNHPNKANENKGEGFHGGVRLRNEFICW